jgi:class 3 adenylate cyclase/predicted ATPase
MSEREQLEQAIAALEAQRSSLGDEVVDAALGPMREKLVALQGDAKQHQQERKQVTVLFADVSGFTRMSEKLDHEEVSGILNALWSRLDKTILDLGGLIDKHIGDAVMALFGTPTAQEDDPERAIRAALAMQAEIKNWKTTFDKSATTLQALTANIQMRIGINTGPVLLGTVGTTGEYTAIGDTVNLASRLEHAAPVGGVLISQDTYQHVRGLFDVTPLDPIQVKGKEEPIQVYVVEAGRPRSFRLTTRGVEGIETRTIGRETELAEMQGALQKVMGSSQLHLVSIVAEAGTGKSRLLYEFIQWLEDQHYSLSLFKGRATQEMTKTPYALIRNLFSTSFEIQDSDPAAVVREKLETGILSNVGSSQEASAHAPFIGHLIGYDYSNDPHLKGLHGDARQIRDLAFHYATQFFINSTRHQAGVILLEDIHWADNGSLDLIEHVMDNQPDLPILIITLSRPSLFEQRASWGDGPYQHIRLDLQPLSSQACRQLVGEILRNVPHIPAVLVDMIIERAEGSPFYVEELIKALIDEGIILRDNEIWTVDIDRLTDLKVPATLTGVLQARLDKLPSRDREVLQQASVVGRVFWNKVLEHMHNPETNHGDSPEIVSDRLHSLEKKEVIFHRDVSAFAETSEYIFKHAILHDVAYESVLLKLRRVYHVQVAERLIELGGERVNEFAGRIGEHFELAEEWLLAAEWYMHAGVQAQETYAPEVAISFYQKALSFLEDNIEDKRLKQKMEICRRLGEVLNWQARYSEAAETYQLLLNISKETGNVEAQSRAFYGLATSLGYQGDHNASLENAVQAEKLAREAKTPIDIVKALWTQGSARFRLGEAQAALKLGEQALTIATDLNNEGEIGRCLNLLGAAHYVTGKYQQAEEYFDRALKISRELRNQRQGMDLLSNLGVIAEARGDHNLALERYQSALEIAREIGYRDGEIVFLTNRGGEQAALENFSAAEADLREAIDLAGAAGSWVLALTYCYLAVACLGQNKNDDAISAAREALTLGQADGSPEPVGIAWRAFGMISERLGKPIISVNDQDSITGNGNSHSAEECFDQSVSILQEAGLDGERARTLREWAKFEIRKGNRDKGKALWQEARETFDKLGASLEVERMANLDLTEISD